MGKLAQFVPHHIFRDKDGHMPPAIMDADGEPHHLGHDGRPAGPGLYYRLLTRTAQCRHFLQQFGINGWTFLSRP
jgi:hypothetical protein